MIDHDFIRAITADRDDDILRLAYADWLEERGDSRGTFLRTEVALASFTQDAPGRADVERRLRELRAGLDPEWLKAVGRTARSACIDVDNVDSIAFAFLQHLYDLGKGEERWPSVGSIGNELGLTPTQTTEVIQHLKSRRMVQWRSARQVVHQCMLVSRLEWSAVITGRGRSHINALLGGFDKRKLRRGRDPGETRE